ncbi:MAG: hypothetical protein CMC40_07240 [Flavobacteriaceae bacterium]|nr:hypothetical protein [Flavobacteriaceae bacterium]|tara:strand:+ start:78 stop:551 length:474 start_codon:yes stop_codon:yes gene_type:complete
MPSGFKVFAVSEVLTAADVNDYLMEQAVTVFSNATARDAAITSPANGQACFLLDSNTLQFYFSSAWNDFVGAGDITGVTITTSSTSGLSGGAAATSGAFASTLVISPGQATSATVAGSDIVLIGDADDSNNLKRTTAQDIANLAAGGVSLGLVIALT